jgi:DNA-binding XRE family transcriptional regulator
MRSKQELEDGHSNAIYLKNHSDVPISPFIRGLLDIVQERFPEIAGLAKQQAGAIEDPDVLRRLTVKISIVKTSKEAEQYLLNPSSVQNRH